MITIFHYFFGAPTRHQLGTNWQFECDSSLLPIRMSDRYRYPAQRIQVSFFLQKLSHFFFNISRVEPSSSLIWAPTKHQLGTDILARYSINYCSPKFGDEVLAKTYPSRLATTGSNYLSNICSLEG